MKLEQIQEAKTLGANNKRYVLIWMSRDEGDIDEVNGPFDSKEACQQYAKGQINQWLSDEDDEWLEEHPEYEKEMWESIRIFPVNR